MSTPVTPRQTPKMRGKKRGKGGTEKQYTSGPLKSKWPNLENLIHCRQANLRSHAVLTLQSGSQDQV